LPGAHPAHGPPATYPESTTLTKRRLRMDAAALFLDAGWHHDNQERP